MSDRFIIIILDAVGGGEMCVQEVFDTLDDAVSFADRYMSKQTYVIWELTASGIRLTHPNSHEWHCVTHDVLVIGSSTQEPVVCDPDIAEAHEHFFDHRYNADCSKCGSGGCDMPQEGVV